MKKVFALIVAVGAFAAVTTAAIATSNRPTSHPPVSCSFGTCFVPDFNAVGDTDTYAGPSASRIEFADCCLAGDKYKVLAIGPGETGSVTFKSKGTQTGTCSTGPYADSSAIELGQGITKVKYTLLATVGTPASAYLRINNAGWAETSGNPDSCGF